MKWRKIKGYPGYKINCRGKILGKYGKFLKHRQNGTGYLMVMLYNSKGKKNKLVHRLVGIAFVPNPENHPLVLHSDNNRANPYYKNLFWGTQKMNIAQMDKEKRRIL